jgi:3-phenylpropionate/trans-cinnamate dioxygenase ferredoxin reductase subunit
MRTTGTKPDAGTIVVIGAGQAGAELAIGVRQQGFTGRIVVVGDEDHPPYRRPPLSKALLHDSTTAHAIRVRASRAYEASGVELRLGVAATRIDRAEKRVELSDGTALRYGKLALTTGGRPRRLAWRPSAPDEVVARNLHTLEDAQRLRTALAPGRRVAFVGGGFVGLEAAAAAARAGVRTLVIEAQPRILGRTCTPEVSAFFARAHRDHGVDLRVGVRATTAERQHDGSIRLVLDDGSTWTADLVLAGIGQVPNDTLAREAGLDVDDGIVVDSRARTSDPDIVAAGDCTRQLHGRLGRRVRLESQHNATEQARIAARTLTGTEPLEPGVPWFWSDQYEHKLQMAGLPQADDLPVVRGDPLVGPFTVLLVRDGRLTGVQAVDNPAEFVTARKLLARDTRLHRPGDARTAPLAQLVGPVAEGAA